jgi:hypothetical protein
MFRRFWRAVMIFLLGGILGTGFGVALGFFLFPFVFPPPPGMERSSSPTACSFTPTRPTRSTGARAR